MRDLTGIELRTDSNGRERCRGFIKERGRKVRGPWGTYADAKAWRVRAMATVLDGGSVLPQKGETVEEASGRFLAGAERGAILSRKDEPYASKTVRGYRQAFEDHITPELGHIAVAGLRRSQVQRWVDQLQVTLANGTVRNTWAALAALYRWLLPRYDDLADPTDGIQLPRPGRPRERYAEPEEMTALLSALPPELALPFALAFYAGLRRAEIQALPVDMIDLDGGWLRVQYALDTVSGWKSPKSGAGERDIPIFEPLRPYLVDRVGGTGLDRVASTSERPGTLLLPSTRASKWGARMLGRPYTKRCALCWTSAGLHTIGLHEARHSFATALIRAGYDVKTVSEWMGHADAATTLRVYAKQRGRQEGLTEKMDTYLIGVR